MYARWIWFVRLHNKFLAALFGKCLTNGNWQLAGYPLTVPNTLVRTVVQNKVIKVQRTLLRMHFSMIVIIVFSIWWRWGRYRRWFFFFAFLSSLLIFVVWFNFKLLSHTYYAHHNHQTRLPQPCRARRAEKRPTDWLGENGYFVVVVAVWIGVYAWVWVYRIIIRLRSTHNSQSFTINNNVNCRRCT